MRATSVALAASAAVAPAVTSAAGAPSRGDTRRVDVSSAGAQASADSRSASISADGRVMAFDSWAANLVADDTNDTRDVFVRHLG
nr:hypothetical protein OG999_16190 [Streptomyces sp. NBC_00886]